LKEINDRLTDRPTTNSTRNVVRGAAGAILSRFFTQQFWREILDLSAVPTNEVRIGDTWVVTRSVPTVPAGNQAAELTYTFKGWQQRESWRCARLEFAGTLKPATPGSRPRDVLRSLTAASPPPPPQDESGAINGVTWFSPDLGLPVETVLDQTTTSRITSSRRVRVTRGTNAAVTLNLNGTNVSVPAPAVTSTNAPPETVTATTRQHLNFKLVEVTAYAPTVAK
jgi:hypothetical protein